MFKTRKKLATLAVAAAMSGGAMMVSAPAHALNVAQNNLGEVLFFPYYTVRGGLDTLFTVTNTTNKTAIFKVRFREALNSREVRDFNVVLSPNDHWSAGITSNTSGGATVRTFDKSCTSPILPDSVAMPGAKEVDFTNYLFTSASSSLTPGGLDGGGDGIGRVQEGYFEVFLMGVSTRDHTDSANTFEWSAKHVNGVPRDCAFVDTALLNPPGAGVIPPTSPLAGFTAPQDILKGAVTYISVANGQAIDANPTALQHWLDGSARIYSAADLGPTLANGDQTQATGFASNTGATAYTKAFATPTNAASAVLSAANVINEYASGSGAGTSWVITFPTKHHYTDDGLGAAVAPFKELFVKASSTAANYGKSCDTVSLTMYDREEKGAAASGTQFSPAQTVAGARLCYEVNVLNFNGSTILGTPLVNHLGVTTTDVGTSGWARIGLQNSGNLGGDATVTGLPTIGFAAFMRFGTTAATGYGSTTQHAYDAGHTGTTP